MATLIIAPYETIDSKINGTSSTGGTYHSSISESVADDDSTYVELKKTNDFIRVRFGGHDQYCSPKIEPTGMSVYFRYRSSDTSVYLTAQLEIADINGNVVYSNTAQSFKVSATGTYETKSFNVGLDDRVKNIILEHIGIGKVPDVRLLLTVTGGSTSKSYTVRLTQAYIELDYEEVKPCIYQKDSNGTWIEVLQVFKKENGSWNLVDKNNYKTIFTQYPLEKGG